VKFLAAIMLLVLPVVTVAQEEAEPEIHPRVQHVLQRAKRDRMKLMPQTALGSDLKDKLPTFKNKSTKHDVEGEGCDKLIAYRVVPDDIPDDVKPALLFVWHGNGGSGKNTVEKFAQTHSKRDPVITIGFQYQLLQEDGKGKFNNPLAAKGKPLWDGARWFMELTAKEFNVDMERIFTAGFSMGTGYCCGWPTAWWNSEPETFPFRGVFTVGSPGYTREKSQCPPIAWINIVGEKETAVKGTINVVANVRNWCNRLAMWDQIVQYHEIPGMGHTFNAQVLRLVRDSMNELGGPGRQLADGEKPDIEPLKFKDANEDIQLLIDLCNADDWKGALTKAAELAEDKELKAKIRNCIKKFPGAAEKVAKDEIKRIEKTLKTCLSKEKLPSERDLIRGRAIVDTWADEKWVARLKFHEQLTQLESDDFGPYKREKERKAEFEVAWNTEANDNRNDAKAMYEKLAKRSDEDEGQSIWPKAAAYRLTWWIDG
jgi:acetyl esterase/lipase